jgi:hypothetical protein
MSIACGIMRCLRDIKEVLLQNGAEEPGGLIADEE